MEITPEYLLKYRTINVDIPAELVLYIDTKKKVKDLEVLWKRDFRPKSSWILKNKLNQTKGDELKLEITELLNKLNKSNFETIYKSIIVLNIVCYDDMALLVSNIIEYSIRDILHAKLYAILCEKLVSFYITDMTEKVHFRDVLLSKCQSTFETSLKTETTAHEYMIGLVKFMGELYNENIIINTVIFMCFVTLYTNVMSNKPNSIEILTTFMTIVGKKYFEKDSEKANSIYIKIEALLQNGNISQKDKFVIMDLQDLQQSNNWQTK